MPAERVASDLAGDELVALFGRAQRRLESIVRDGLRRGLDPNRAYTPEARRGDATLRYRAMQMVRAQALLGDLERQAKAGVPRAVRASYRGTMRAVDATLGPALNFEGTFATVHFRAVEALAANMTTALERATRQAGDNVAAVFERADAIEGALEAGRSPSPGHFIGRRINDPYRRIALEEVAQGVIGLDTRRQVSANLARELVDQGVTDAVTGFVDRSGRRWPLDTYAEMVARTTTREASTRATVNRMSEGGAGIVTITSHPHKSDVCSPYDGRTFALNAELAARLNLPRLELLPPFHPRCRHVVTAGTGNLDDFELALERAVADELGLRDPLVERGRDVYTDLRTDTARQNLADLTDAGADGLAMRQASGDALVKRGYAVAGIDLDEDLAGRFYATEYGAGARTALDEYVAAGKPAANFGYGPGFEEARTEAEAYALWQERDARAAMRSSGQWAEAYKCFNCNLFVAGPEVQCPHCGYAHGGGNHKAYVGTRVSDRQRRRSAQRRAERRRR